MKKKNKKNKKRKVLRVFIFIVIIAIFSVGIYYLPVKNIYVTGNSLLTDQEIIELAGLENYPRLFASTSKSLENKIKINPIIEKVTIKKSLFGRVTITVLEYTLLLKDEMDNGIYLSNLEKLNLDFKVVGIPSLVNYVDTNILNEFLTKLKTIDKAILSKISEIEYSPNEYDKDLFLFYMNDGNYVYITTTKLLNINKYAEVLETLDGKKGILYLDSGNHFEILE